MSTVPEATRAGAGAAGPTALLAEFVAGLKFSDIPTSVVEHAKLAVLDTVGCGLFGSQLPWARILREVVGEHDRGREATVWGTPERVSVLHAPLLNGTFVHGFELDDLHKRSILHAGGVVVTTVFALAEAMGGASGQDLLTAIVAGYEAGARVGEAAGTAHLRRGFHPTGTHGAVAAAAAAARLLNLPPEQVVDALGTGASQGAGLMAAQFSSMVKRMHAGRAAQSGLYAALLAQRGFTGIRDVFENPYGGYLSTLSDDARLDIVTRGLGETWETAKVGFKWYPACGSCHTSIDAMLTLRREHGVTADQVARIRVRCSSATKEHVGWDYVPDSITTAQMNLAYCAAVALLDGEVFVEQFRAERLRDPAILDLTRRVEVTASPEIDAMGPSYRHRVEVEIDLADGAQRSITVDHALGSDARPLSREAVLDKYRRLSETVLSPGESRALQDVLLSLETRTMADVAAGLARGAAWQSQSGW